MNPLKILATAFVVVFFFGMVLFCWSACVLASKADERERQGRVRKSEDIDND